MESITNLDVATNILAILELSYKLASIPPVSQVDSKKLIDNYMRLLAAKNIELGQTLEKQRQTFTVTRPLIDTVELHDLGSSCVVNTGKVIILVTDLLEELSSDDRSEPWEDTRSRVESMVADKFKFRKEQIEIITRLVAQHVKSTIR